MSARLRLWLVALVFFGVLAAQLFGNAALRWYKEVGGPGTAGVVNLPAAMASYNGNVLSTNTIAREGFNMRDLSKGLTLIAPSNMSGSISAVSCSAGANVCGGMVEGSFIIDGHSLELLRGNQVFQFDLVLVDTEMRYLRIRVVLSAGDSSYKVIVW